jgi:hypothetical protein
MIAEKKLSPIERGKEGTHGREKKPTLQALNYAYTSKGVFSCSQKR